MPDSAPRPNARAAVADAVILDGGKILLVKRGREPEKGKWAVPGGHMERDETAEEACVREVKEETGLEVRIVKLIGVFSSPSRDPIRQTVASAYLCVPAGSTEAKGGDDAAEAKWFRLKGLPPLAFDHAQMVAAALATESSV